MPRHLYRLCKGAYVEALFRRNEQDKVQMIWLQYNLMRLGSEIVRSEHSSGVIDQLVRHTRAERQAVSDFRA
ncbi:hypothetical protein [Bradyrhizobium sp. Cp5.3]|uniref:hypothetical protein n=1 Tax=Bradyrhizobium sp. Cp5.3 TaxID=443598 RepID=UPI00047F2E3F|nr:hypothetical protein [Bradyrhizobium sp. Cp5.3]